MTATITVEKHYDLLNRITANLGLEALLDILAGEIEDLAISDGYVINLIDAEHENLLSLKLRFTPAFAHLESTYHKYRTSLSSGGKLATTTAFHERTMVRFDSSTGSQTNQDYLKRWRMNDFAVLPILTARATEALPLGTVSLIKESGRIDDSKLLFLRDLLCVFYVPLQTALKFAFLEEFQAKLKSAAQEHARALRFIVEVNNLTNREKILELFTAELFKRFGFECLGLFLREGEILKNVRISCSTPRFDDIKEEWASYLSSHHYGLHLIDGGPAHVFEKNAPLVFSDVQTILNLPMSEMDAHTLRILRTPRTLVIVPIRYQNHAIGAMTLLTLSQVLPIPEADLQLLLTLSAFFGAAIINSDNFAIREKQNLEIARLNKALQNQVIELAEQAATDKLTGLLNFRTFEQELGRHIQARKECPGTEGFSLAVVDIDHFKRFNDTYGHGAGNQVLAGVAATVSRLVRENDMAFRYGGEEFVILMEKYSFEDCMAFAERARKAVEETSFETEAGILSVTVSIGCASYAEGDTYQSFFDRADQALYQAKRNGRNQIAGHRVIATNTQALDCLTVERSD